MAPVIVASTINIIHMLCPKFIPSFLPDIDSSIKAIMAIDTPIHWYRLRASPKKSMAPTSVSIGCDALMGAAIVMGRCLVEK